MADGWSVQLVATFVAALIGAVVGVASMVLTAVIAWSERRNTNFLAHRRDWWERWSWIAERALSGDPRDERAAIVLLDTIQRLPWRHPDDEAIAIAINTQRELR